MHLTSIHSLEEERFITTGVRQSVDYNSNSVFWLGARLFSSSTENISWIDGTNMMYQGWPPYNDSESSGIGQENCLGIQVRFSVSSCES